MAEERARTFADTRRYTTTLKHTRVELVNFPELNFRKNRASLARVYNVDPLEVAEICLNSGYKPLMLTEINENYPIPGISKGGLMGQESELLLRSDYVHCLIDTLYPIKRRNYTFSVINVVKGPDYSQTKPYKVPLLGATVIRSPSIGFRQVDGKGLESYSSSSDETLMRETILGAFEYAMREKYDTLILPALGCERGHPVDTVIGLFNEAMQKYDVPYVFYAVKSYHEPGKAQFLRFHEGIVRKTRPGLVPEIKEVGAGNKDAKNRRSAQIEEIEEIEEERDVRDIREEPQEEELKEGLVDENPIAAVTELTPETIEPIPEHDPPATPTKAAGKVGKAGKTKKLEKKLEDHDSLPDQETPEPESKTNPEPELKPELTSEPESKTNPEPKPKRKEKAVRKKKTSE